MVTYSSLESVAPFRRGQSAQLLGHASPADMAFCGETLPSGRSTGLGGVCPVFGGSDLEKEYESRRMSAATAAAITPLPPAAAQRRGRDQPCTEGRDRGGERIIPIFQARTEA